MTDWRDRPVTGYADGTILYDGVCVFCSRWVQFVVARDTARFFRFAPVQSAIGEGLAQACGIDPAAPQTNAVILDGRAWFKSDAAIEVVRRLPGWRWVAVARIVPKPVRDWLYDRIARNRYRLFGRSDVCLMPPPGLAAQVLRDSGPGNG